MSVLLVLSKIILQLFLLNDTEIVKGRGYVMYMCQDKPFINNSGSQMFYTKNHLRKYLDNNFNELTGININKIVIMDKSYLKSTT